MTSEIEYMGMQPLHFQKPRPTKQPMTKAEAQKIMDSAIRRTMEERKCSYVEAFSILQKDKPDLIQGFSVVTRRKK